MALIAEVDHDGGWIHGFHCLTSADRPSTPGWFRHGQADVFQAVAQMVVFVDDSFGRVTVKKLPGRELFAAGLSQFPKQVGATIVMQAVKGALNFSQVFGAENFQRGRAVFEVQPMGEYPLDAQ